jgi:hypothetical protein
MNGRVGVGVDQLRDASSIQPATQGRSETHGSTPTNCI